MINFSALFPGMLTFGAGSLENHPAILEITGKTGVIVTGTASASKNSSLKGVMNLVKKSNAEAFVFDGVEPEVSVETADKAAAFCREKKASFIIGLGGGSAIDCAKAAATASVTGAKCADYLDGKISAGSEVLYFIAVPTTSGTGSEVTKNAVLKYTAKNIKASLRGNNLVPRTVIADPLLTVSMPEKITAYSGLDALTHAVESYLSTGANPMTMPLASEAVRLIAANLEAACENGSDIEARSNVMLASLLAGLSFATAGLGAVHGMGHPVGAVCSLPHGLVNAILLPYILRLNKDASEERIKQLETSSGVKLEETVSWLNRSLGIPERISGACPDAASHIEEIIKTTAYSGSMAYNPVKMDENLVRKVLKEAI